jgi:transcriptional regulator with XRE-family HTH domain
LHLSQRAFGQLLGLDRATILRWEADRQTPGRFHAALIRHFVSAVRRQPRIGLQVDRVLRETGTVTALYELLRVSIGDRPGVA